MALAFHKERQGGVRSTLLALELLHYPDMIRDMFMCMLAATTSIQHLHILRNILNEVTNLVHTTYPTKKSEIRLQSKGEGTLLD